MIHAGTHQFFTGDALSILKTLPSESVHCIITSPLAICLAGLKAVEGTRRKSSRSEADD